MKSAEQVVLESIDQLLAAQDNDLIIPYSKVNKEITDVVQRNAKIVTRMVDKVLREADRHITAVGDALDSVQTRVLQGLDSYAWDQEYLLSHLAAKSGMIQPGDALETALLQQTADAPQLAYAGTLVLAVHEAVPWLERIATALEVMATWIPQESMQERINRLNGDDLLAGLLTSESTSQGSMAGVGSSSTVRLWQLEEVYGRVEEGITRAPITPRRRKPGDPPKVGDNVSRGEILPADDGSTDPFAPGSDVPSQAWLDATSGLLEAYRRLVTPARPDPFTGPAQGELFPEGFRRELIGD